MPKLSIITICYNEPFLEKTCESIVNEHDRGQKLINLKKEFKKCFQ